MQRIPNAGCFSLSNASFFIQAVTHITELSFAMAAHLRQAEEWTAMYETYANQLNGHNERILEAAAAAANTMDNSRSSLFGAPFGKLSSLRM